MKQVTEETFDLAAEVLRRLPINEGLRNFLLAALRDRLEGGTREPVRLSITEADLLAIHIAAAAALATGRKDIAILLVALVLPLDQELAACATSNLTIH